MIYVTSQQATWKDNNYVSPLRVTSSL